MTSKVNRLKQRALNRVKLAYDQMLSEQYNIPIDKLYDLGYLKEKFLNDELEDMNDTWYSAMEVYQEALNEQKKNDRFFLDLF